MKLEQQKKLDAGKWIYKNGSAQSIAQRAVFNCASSGACNFLGQQELVNDFISGKVELADIKKDHLPESMQELDLEELAATLRKAQKDREAVQTEIKALSAKRQEWISKELAKRGDEAPVLDKVVYESIRTQAATRGIRYSAVAPKL